MIRVLVTGAGSGVGQGIVKALRLADLDVCVISGDIGPLNAALYRTDEAIIVPRVELDGALPLFVKVIESARVDLVLPGSEFDIAFLAAHREYLEEATSARIGVSNLASVQTCNDKWQTYEKLTAHSVACPRSVIDTDPDSLRQFAEEVGFPIIAKPRSGTSARGQVVAKTMDQLLAAALVVPEAIFQEFLIGEPGGIGSEFTCAFFRSRAGVSVGPFVARRSLRGGTSWVIEVAPFPLLHDYLCQVARSIEFEGSLNIQLIVGKEGPRTIELNCRFSGTTAVRAHFGFNEPAMSVRDLLLGESPPIPEIGEGVVFRYVEEVFVDGARLDTVLPSDQRGTRHSWF